MNDLAETLADPPPARQPASPSGTREEGKAPPRTRQWRLFHNILGSHHADMEKARWCKGRHVGRCEICGRGMTKLPGLPWVVNSLWA